MVNATRKMMLGFRKKLRIIKSLSFFSNSEFTVLWFHCEHNF